MKLAIIFVILIIAVIAVIFIREQLNNANSNQADISDLQKEASQSRVCNDDDIAKYNETLGYDSDEGAGASDQALATLAASIKARENHESDATCQYILWQNSYFAGDTQQQKQHADKLAGLEKKGQKASDKIESRDDVEAIQALTAEQKSREEQGNG